MIATAKKTRTLVSGGSKTDIALWVITKHNWEYYLEEPDENGQAFGYVMGAENEWGYVDLKELEPFITYVATGKELMTVAPPMSDYTNMEWED